MRKEMSVCAAGLALLAQVALGSDDGDAVDSFVEAQLKRGRVPGMSIAVVRAGKIEKARGYGLADVENQVPATERTVYEWASVTKQFTAEAIMMLAHEGKLRLEDRLAAYYAKTPAAWSNVTIRHLLTHTSGIRSHTELPDFIENVQRDYSPDEVIGKIRDLPLSFQPGEGWRYSNTGYYLLGLVIEKVSGGSYGDFLAARIFGPLGMTTARMYHPFELVTNRATGYTDGRSGVQRSLFVSHTQPYSAGGLMGSVLDLARWDAALYTEKLLPAALREEMWRATTFSDGKTKAYGYGWQLGDIHGHRFVGHGGLNGGFTSYILRLLDDKLTVMAICNGPGNPERVARGIAAMYVRGLSLASIDPQPDPDPGLSKRLEQCLTELAQRKDSEMLTPEFRKEFSRSRNRHGNLVRDLKDRQSFTFVISEKAARDRSEAVRVNAYRLGTAGGARFYSFGLTADNKVVALETEE